MRATSSDDARERMIRDIYATDGAWDLEKMVIMPVRVAGTDATSAGPR